jgi:hypothetical protein
MGWATLWAIFSQARQVTLVPLDIRGEEGWCEERKEKMFCNQITSSSFFQSH